MWIISNVRNFKISFLVLSIVFISVHSLIAQVDQNISEEFAFEEARQFDFWVGEWDVNLRIRQPDFSWKDAMTSKAHIYRILDGKAILELWNSQQIKGYSLRYYDNTEGKWMLYLNWPGPNRSGTSSLSGAFRHGRGEFFSTSIQPDSTEIISRYTFSDVTPNSLRWDDAFSRDGGNTWSNNWIMEWNRTGSFASMPDAENHLLTYESGDRCSLPEFREFESLEGLWKGMIKTEDENGREEQSAVQLRGYKVLDGCAIVHLMEIEREGQLEKHFSIKTYNTYAGRYEDTRLSNQLDTPVVIYYGSKNGQSIDLMGGNSGAEGNLKKFSWNISVRRSGKWNC